VQIAQRAFEHGLVIETSGANDEVLKVLPALTIEDEVLVRGLEIIERSVEHVLARKGVSAGVLKFERKAR
ncbi:MAG TPA: diaminobutyrate--2-oxoglutarate transaminase, partial [Burkholderiaceae bacterium]|nr:diaminobutyrate--2-oxoglutarate transaminase [Burkholderiaceae bacterium]